MHQNTLCTKSLSRNQRPCSRFAISNLLSHIHNWPTTDCSATSMGASPSKISDLKVALKAGGKLVAAIDQGTTSTRVIIFDERARAVASHQQEHQQIYPQDGWCEHDPMEIVEATKSCVDKAIETLEALGGERADVCALGITNQRETTVVWDKLTGKPLHNAIVWLDLRTAALAEELSEMYETVEHGGKDRFRAVCGLPISTVSHTRSNLCPLYIYLRELLLTASGPIPFPVLLGTQAALADQARAGGRVRRQ